MKNVLPEAHGLSTQVLEKLIYLENGAPSLSDVQFKSLEAGVGRGESLLVVSPTSTGKTQIGLWAIAQGLINGNHTVYLVTHRALAKQKFEDFKNILLTPYLHDDKSSIVIATGDYIEDADGGYPAEPLGASLLIATYEKYLALLSASGVPKDLRNTVIVCDEIQLLGDEHRGQNVEVLLTLLRNARWKQFVGLSAVLQPKDAKELSEWLDVNLLVEQAREKHIRYECWTRHGVLSASSSTPNYIDDANALPCGAQLTVMSALENLLKHTQPPVPIIVFCMKKQDTYDLAQEFINTFHSKKNTQLSLAFEGLPETSANTFLAETLEYRVASHNADLMDEERNIVEQHLLDGKLDVVFATTTLAAGVNFPLGAAVFANWTRWNSDTQTHNPIDASDFHNMSGRVGRMGFEHEEGRVIFFAEGAQINQARKYLAIGELPAIEPRVTPRRFNQLALQLLSSGLCESRSALQALVCSAFSSLKELDRNPKGFASWPNNLDSAINSLIESRFVVESSSGVLSVTPVGKAVGFSGLLPETGSFFVKYLVKESQYLSELIGRLPDHNKSKELAILLFSACLSSPEFRPQAGGKPTRFLPYPLVRQVLFDADYYSDHLVEKIWRIDPLPITSAWMCYKWIEGTDLRELEGEADQLRAGMLTEMYRNLTWTLQGLSAIAVAAADNRIHPSLRPSELNVEGHILDAIRKTPRLLSRLGYRVQEGLPDSVLWMASLCPPGSSFRLGRHEILALKSAGITTPQQLMLGTPEANQARLSAFPKSKPSPQAKANWIRDICKTWKIDQRKRAADRHIQRAKKCTGSPLIEAFYAAKGDAFEIAFESVLEFLSITYQKLDSTTKTGAPDYLVTLADSPAIVVELKSKEGDNLVDYNKSVEVLAASEVHGYKDAFCVTLCHPGVDPSVSPVIISCGRLSVVESGDLGEALLRLCEGLLTQQQVWQWITTPGQANAVDLPYRIYD